MQWQHWWDPFDQGSSHTGDTSPGDVLPIEHTGEYSITLYPNTVCWSNGGQRIQRVWRGRRPFEVIVPTLPWNALPQALRCNKAATVIRKFGKRFNLHCSH
ncbi:hypothetical protein NP493_10g02023 [Ridgeia piscesae]|uniref:Uncharacterized protein n=1 Tax=Ridgeia piscesae TaxID=27915 RepID=A0AAD9ULC3_RIDPI|nr:hypothetical protein NP493_10g02023 [Ridgeia piscesae]